MAIATNQEPTTIATTKRFLYHPKYNSKQTQPNTHNKPITKPPPTANQPPQTTTTITGSATNFKSKNLNKRGGKNQNLQQTLLAHYSHKHRQPKTQPTTAITTTPPPAYNPNPTDRSMTQNSHIKTHPKSHTHDLIKRSEGRR